MMTKWTREDCLAAIAAMAPKSVSLSGSRSSPTQALAAATAGNHRQLLAAANAQRVGNGNGTPPRPVGQQGGRHPAYGALDEKRLHSQSPHRRPSASSVGKGSSSAAAKGPVRVEELKRVLANGVFTALASGPAARKREQGGDDTASESMVTADEDMGSEDGYGFGTGAASPANRGKPPMKDLSALLDGIKMEEGTVRRVSGMTRPPY